MFAYDADRFQVEPCTKLTVTVVNEDDVRHQWMLHGLPTETYPMGMFNVEVRGQSRVTATFVVPSGDRTLRVHCSLPQHDEKGMHAAFVVGSGGAGDGHDHGHSTAQPADDAGSFARLLPPVEVVGGGLVAVGGVAAAAFAAMRLRG